MRFSEQFGLNGNQSEFDFVDVPLETDVRVFIDPYAVTTNRTPMCRRSHALVSKFFQRVLDRLKAGDRIGAKILLSRLGEDNRTRTGYSEGRPDGTGVGPEKADLIIDALLSSEAFESGNIGDIEEGALLANTIGIDTVSDIMVALMRGELAEYTLQQCEFYGIRVDTEAGLWIWHPRSGWDLKKVMLPTDGDRPILLFPRAIARRDLSLRPDDYLTDFFDHYIDREHERATAALEKTLQQRIPTKKNKKAHRGRIRDLLDERGTRKEVVGRIIREFPESLRSYKRRARKNRPSLSAFELEETRSDRRSVDVRDVAARFKVAKENLAAAENADAAMDEYLRGLTGSVVAAFHPYLQHPMKLDADVNGFRGAVLANTGASGVLWDARKRGGGADSANVILLASSKMINDEVLRHIRLRSLLAEHDAGAVLLVGPRISKSVRENRSRLAGRGLLVSSVGEIAALVEADLDPSLAVDQLTALLS